MKDIESTMDGNGKRIKAGSRISTDRDGLVRVHRITRWTTGEIYVSYLDFKSREIYEKRDRVFVPPPKKVDNKTVFANGMSPGQIRTALRAGPMDLEEIMASGDCEEDTMTKEAVCRTIEVLKTAGEIRLNDSKWYLTGHNY